MSASVLFLSLFFFTRCFLQPANVPYNVTVERISILEDCYIRARNAHIQSVTFAARQTHRLTRLLYLAAEVIPSIVHVKLFTRFLHSDLVRQLQCLDFKVLIVSFHCRSSSLFSAILALHFYCITPSEIDNFLITDFIQQHLAVIEAVK